MCMQLLPTEQSPVERRKMFCSYKVAVLENAEASNGIRGVWSTVKFIVTLQCVVIFDETRFLTLGPA